VVACDFALVADDAQLGTPEINVGLWPMMIMATIFRNVPRKRGLELICTGDKVSAAEAASMGLVTRAVPKDKLEAEVDALAQKLASKSPIVMKMGLEAFYKVQDLELQPALEYLQGQLVAVLGTEDAREGLMAFLEKRAPNWKGR
jgi:enoyl-CoA hydratase/carnithine racemase